jgi:NO-binding membrane sensor protein with MHYT domain
MKMLWLIQSKILLQVYGITPGRAAALLPVLLALISLIVGGITLARSSSQPSYGQLSAIIALVISVVALYFSGMHLTRSITEPIGSGSGRLGATVALILGLTGMIVSGLALLRLRKKIPENVKSK